MKDVQAGTITTDDFRMDYFRFGQGPQTLVILSGLSVKSVTDYAAAVAEAYSLLADAFTVYVLDRRKDLPAEYPVYRMAADSAAAIRTLGTGPVCLFGASQGGMIAMTIAIEQPELVRRLILGSTAARMDPERYQTVEEWLGLARAGDAKALYLAFGKAIYPPEVFEQSRDLLAAAALGVSDRDLQRFVILAEGMKHFDVTDRLRRIACPVLVIGSRDDRVLGPDAAGEIGEQFSERPNAELFLYDGYGHAAYDTAPDYKERIKRFLTSGPAR